MSFKGVEGWYNRVEGAENVLEIDICVENGIAMTGAGSLEMTKVALRVVDPVASVAVRSIVTPVTVSDPTSPVEGVPENVRVLLSSDNQLGPLESVYDIDSGEENVELEKVYKKGFDTRATGGTCELRGKATTGLALT